MDPQQGPLRIPLSEDIPSEEPLGGSILMDLTCNVVVWRRIWRGEPTSGLLLQLVPCDWLQHQHIVAEQIDDKRLILFTLLAISCIASSVLISFRKAARIRSRHTQSLPDTMC